MSNVDVAVEELIKAIKESEKYVEYRRQLDMLNQMPDLKRQVDDFRMRNFMMQTSEDLDFAILADFEKQYKGFRENPLVDSFLAAELDFCKMIQEMNFHITESFDFQ